MADCKRKTANLFDYSTVVIGKYINASGQEATSSSSGENALNHSDYIPVVGTTYTFKCSKAVNYTGASNAFCWFDSSKQLISRDLFDVEGGSNTILGTATAPTGAAYLIMNYRGLHGDTGMLNSGSTVLPYEPYWQHSLRKLTTATDTITTLPADIYADGTNATVGLKGNMSQTGTPTPSSPIQPSECGERTANLFDYKTAYAQYLSGDDIVITPTQMTSEKQYFKTSEVGKTITISVYAKTVTSNRVFIRASIGGTNINSNTVSRGNSGTLTVTVTPTSTSDFFNLTYGDGGDYNTFNKFMVNSGSTALPYEPYGYKLTISSANTTTPVYLGEVESTRKIKKLVLTGKENWTKNDVSNPSNYLYYQPGYLANKTCVCSHLADMGTLSASKVGVFNGNTVLYLNFGSAIMNAQPSGNTVAGLKEYIAAQYANGTPVTVWYVLATEETGIVNEPIRKIGDYADTVSGITIPTITGKDTIDVETTLKPSEVSLSYTGWHDTTVKEWDGSQWNE